MRGGFVIGGNILVRSVFETEEIFGLKICGFEFGKFS
jgi:hypothetical protein